MQRQVELIGAGWGLGGADPACGDAPAVLAPLVAARLGACGVAVAPGPILRPMANERRKQLAVSRLCGLLASAVADARRRGRLPCVLGGDHSCAGGTWSGVARTLQEKSEGSLGLLWIDAHMDSHTPGTSHTGRLHGMPLAWLLGQDDDPLYGLASGVVEARNVCIVGVRSFEPEERERLERLGVRVFFMDEIRDRGLAAVFREALGIVSGRTAAFGISIDLDVVSPEEVPHVGTPVHDGMASAALAAALEGIGADPRLAAIELVEYSPRLDAEGRSARVAVELLAAALCGRGGGRGGGSGGGSGGPGEDAQVAADALHR
jgi:arginase